MPETEVRDRIAGLVRAALNVEEIETDADLIGSGLMDSLSLVALITDIEEDFGIELPLDDFDIESFRSIDSIADFVSPVLSSGKN